MKGWDVLWYTENTIPRQMRIHQVIPLQNHSSMNVGYLPALEQSKVSDQPQWKWQTCQISLVGLLCVHYLQFSSRFGKVQISCFLIWKICLLGPPFSEMNHCKVFFLKSFWTSCADLHQFYTSYLLQTEIFSCTSLWISNIWSHISSPLVDFPVISWRFIGWWGLCPYTITTCAVLMDLLGISL